MFEYTVLYPLNYFMLLSKNKFDNVTWDPASRIHCGCSIQIHTDYRNPMEERDNEATPSRGERPTLALTGFYCFSRPLTSKMVLLYYAKVCFGWLSFPDKGEGVR